MGKGSKRGIANLSTRIRRRKQAGKHLRDKRVDLELSQEEVAKRADIHRSEVSDAERGADNYGIDTYLAIQEALKAE